MIRCADCDRVLHRGGPFPKQWSGEGGASREPCPGCGSTGRSYSVHVSDHINISDHVEGRIMLRAGPFSVVAGETLDVKVATYGTGTYGSGTYGNPTAELTGASAGTSSMTGSLSIEVEVPTRRRDQLELTGFLLAGMGAGSTLATTVVNTQGSKVVGMAVGVLWAVRTYKRMRPATSS